MEPNPLYPHAPRYENYSLPAYPFLAGGVDKQIEGIKNFDSRETDILLSTYPKSGTNWAIDILHMLTTGKTEYSQLKYTESRLEISDLSRLSEIEESPRLLRSHLPFRHLPKKHIENGYKIIHVMRNPKDVAVSLYHHLQKSKIHATDSFPGTWNTFIENFIEKKIDLYGNWFNHAKEWEAAQITGRCTNVHTTMFEDLKRDPVGEIKRMSVYLGHQHSDEFLDEVATRCLFENIVEATKTQAKDISNIKCFSVDGSDFIRRKGEVGNWKQWFTVDQNERFDDLIEREMKDSNVRTTYEL